jgi:hypothetical protein
MSEARVPRVLDQSATLWDLLERCGYESNPDELIRIETDPVSYAPK